MSHFNGTRKPLLTPADMRLTILAWRQEFNHRSFYPVWISSIYHLPYEDVLEELKAMAEDDILGRRKNGRFFWRDQEPK